jgi:hypothetical protein
MKQLKPFLDSKVELYNNPGFIAEDPISIPHQFSKKEDIEISGFLAASIAWGQRKTILKNSNQLIYWMDKDPLNFILNFTVSKRLKPFSFKYDFYRRNDKIGQSIRQ